MGNKGLYRQIMLLVLLPYPPPPARTIASPLTALGFCILLPLGMLSIGQSRPPVLNLSFDPNPQASIRVFPAGETSYNGFYNSSLTFFVTLSTLSFTPSTTFLAALPAGSCSSPTISFIFF